jgi:energy-coupling factor transporter ATP-binding protein EcfA2
MLHLAQLCFQYSPRHKPIFENFSWKLDSGQGGMIIGDNGSGKSTLGKMICGLMLPTAGSVQIDGLNPYVLKPAQRIKKAYYLTQVNQLQFVKSTLQDEIRACEKLSGNMADKNLYSFFFLPENLNFNPFELSVNEAWRFALYLATIVNPSLLFIDEIPSAVNERNKTLLAHIMSERKKNNQITILCYQRPILLTFDKTICLE